MRRWAERALGAAVLVRPLPLDVALAALTSVAVLAGAAITGDLSYGGTVPLAVSLGLVLLVRRRRPVPVLVCSAVLLAGFGSSDLGTPGWVWPATVAYVTVVLAGGFWWALGVGVVTLVAMVPYVPSAWPGIEALWLALVLVGAYAYVDRARHRVTEERLVIARELHDVVAHTLAVVGIHLNVAADTLDDDPEEAREALRLAQSVRGQAMADLRSMVGILRAGPMADGVPDLAELVARTSATGLPVRLAGDLAGLPAPVALAAYRVVQEGLTNVLKHANASTAAVTVTRNPTEVTVSVRDGGRDGAVTQRGDGLAGDGDRDNPGTQGGDGLAGDGGRDGPATEADDGLAGDDGRGGPAMHGGVGLVRDGGCGPVTQGGDGLTGKGGRSGLAAEADEGMARGGGCGGPVTQRGVGLAGKGGRSGLAAEADEGMARGGGRGLVTQGGVGLAGKGGRSGLASEADYGMARDGDRGGPVTQGGYGLAGLRERVTVLGGTLASGPVDGGFELVARLPLS